MNRLRHNPMMDIAVLTVMALYFLVATTHILFISRQTNSTHQTHATGNSIFKRKTDTFSANTSAQTLLQRPDKSTFEEKNGLSDVLENAAQFFLVLFFMPLVWQLRPKFGAYFIAKADLPRYTYLSLQTIRI